MQSVYQQKTIFFVKSPDVFVITIIILSQRVELKNKVLIPWQTCRTHSSGEKVQTKFYQDISQTMNNSFYNFSSSYDFTPDNLKE